MYWTSQSSWTGKMVWRNLFRLWYDRYISICRCLDIMAYKAELPVKCKYGSKNKIIPLRYHKMQVKIALTFTFFEAIIVTVTSDQKWWICVHAPECKKSSAPTHNIFIRDFTPTLVDHLCTTLNVFLLDDFNYHVNSEANAYTTEFLGFPECFGLKNHVEIETHIKDNTLDLVITREYPDNSITI